MNPTKPQRPNARRFSSVHLLIALALLFLTSPFIQDLRYAKAIEGVLVMAVLLSALFAVAGRGSILIGSILAAVAIIARWIEFFNPSMFPISLLPASAFVIFVISRLLRHVLSAEDVNHETLCACISGFLMIGLLWTIAFTAIGKLDPHAFSFSVPGESMDGFDAFYFSYITLSTIGYGDIAPISRVARMLCVMEAITGMFYVAILVARLVSIYSSRPNQPKPDAE